MSVKSTVITKLLKTVLLNKNLRKLVQGKFEKQLYKSIVEESNSNLPKVAREDKFNGVKAMYLSTLRNVDRGYVKKGVAKKIISTLVLAAMVDTPESLKIKAQYKKKYGRGLPGLLVLSPTKTCNLKCMGCYASSSSADKNTLEWKYYALCVHTLLRR